MKNNIKHFLLLTATVLVFFSCEEEEKSQKEKLISSLNNELHPLEDDPRKWEDKELKFLNPIASKSKIIGLGEATHGSAEFFNAKTRIFKYLVENHGYKTFAFEADFSESIIINRAIQKGNSSQIKTIMENNMIFWTWKTEEVRNLLEWMSEYNKGKPEEEKVHYMGIDCQYNRYNPLLLYDYLENANISFTPFADSILNVAKTATEENFTTYGPEEFDKYIDKLEALKDSMNSYKNTLIENSSEREYNLHVRILEVVKQASKVRKRSDNKSLRDSYMAKNALWILDYFNKEKIAVWGHNGHIRKASQYRYWMGYYLDREIGADYTPIGFAFSYGSFNAVKIKDEGYGYLKAHTITSEPLENSLNGIFSKANSSTFSISISDLRTYDSWKTKLSEDSRYLVLGAGYNSQPLDYYPSFKKDYFDYFIYFDEVTETDLLFDKKKGVTSSPK